MKLFFSKYIYDKHFPMRENNDIHEYTYRTDRLGMLILPNGGRDNWILNSQGQWTKEIDSNTNQYHQSPL